MLPVANAILVSHAVVAVAAEKIAPFVNDFMEFLPIRST